MTDKIVARTSDGETPWHHTPVGCYTLVYLDGRGRVLCPKCAAEAEDDPDCPEIDKPVSGGTYDEGPPLECQSGMGCGTSEILESSYGEIEEDA